MKLSQEELNEARMTADEWRMSGEDLHKEPEMREKRLPRHPGFVYRNSGDWKGWNHFLGVTDTNSEEYRINEQTDKLEAAAYKIYWS